MFGLKACVCEWPGKNSLAIITRCQVEFGRGTAGRSREGVSRRVWPLTYSAGSYSSGLPSVCSGKWV